MNIHIDQTRYEPIPVGEYTAEIDSIEAVTGQFGDQLKMKFCIQSPEDYMDRVLLGWCSAKFTPKSKLFKWTQAILFSGGPVPEEYGFDSDGLVGHPCRIVVLTKADDKGGEFNKIDDVKPYRKPTQAKAQPKVQPKVVQPEPAQPDLVESDQDWPDAEVMTEDMPE